MENKELKGINGWMILIAIGIWSSFITLFFSMSLWKYIGLFAQATFLLCFLATFYTLYLMHNHKKRFILMAKVHLILILIVEIIFANATRTLFNYNTILHPAILSAIFWTIIIWAYLNESVRVKNTFVN